MALFKIFKDETGKYRFFLKSNHNQIIFTSRGYSSRLICFNYIQLIKKFALKDEKYERHISLNESPYFEFKVSKNKVIGISEKFISKNVMENIIAMIKTNANEAKIDSITYSI
ncbi:DUF1508 domain-containing protein [uncultured Algibacter sp.]|jgi:uncharacterized protein YegP (UPF0339 family)|uniref:YegP family protein n=1 Tax=uncultured Algibacter sp. TaxID=298659 RepID=UPI00261BCA13|nr:DUF1508 domain-containing protein [uncultured Algibacter sp.]